MGRRRPEVRRKKRNPSKFKGVTFLKNVILLLAKLKFFFKQRRRVMEIKYRYVVCQGGSNGNEHEFIADCATEERAVDFCAKWLKEKMINALEEKDQIVFGGVFNIAIHKIEEK